MDTGQRDLRFEHPDQAIRLCRLRTHLNSCSRDVSQAAAINHPRQPHPKLITRGTARVMMPRSTNRNIRGNPRGRSATIAETRDKSGTESAGSQRAGALAMAGRPIRRDDS